MCYFVLSFHPPFLLSVVNFTNGTARSTAYKIQKFYRHDRPMMQRNLPMYLKKKNNSSAKITPIDCIAGSLRENGVRLLLAERINSPPRVGRQRAPSIPILLSLSLSQERIPPPRALNSANPMLIRCGGRLFRFTKDLCERADHDSRHTRAQTIRLIARCLAPVDFLGHSSALPHSSNLQLGRFRSERCIYARLRLIAARAASIMALLPSPNTTSVHHVEIKIIDVQSRLFIAAVWTNFGLSNRTPRVWISRVEDSLF